MKHRYGRLTLLFTLLSLLSPVGLGAQCKIDGFDNSRVDSGWSVVNGSRYARLRTFLTNPNYFGTNGAVPNPITLGSGQTLVTSGSLSGVKVFATGWIVTSTISAGERAALQSFVASGGNLIIFADDINHSIVSDYGVTQDPISGGGGSSSDTIVNTNHVLFNGPFGRVSNITPFGNIGQFTAIPGTATILATNIGGTAGRSTGAVLVIPEGVLSPTSGRVIILNDSDYSSDFGPPTTEDDIFTLNLFAYACGVANTPGGNTYYFPQVAFQGGYSTLVEAGNSLSTSTYNPGWTWQFFDPNGTSIGTCGPGQLHPNGTDGCVQSGPSSSPVQTGWSRARSANFQPFFPQEIFKFQNAGALFAVGVPPATPGLSFTLEGPFSAAEQVGIAFLNLPTSTGTAHITVKAFDGFGGQIGSTGTVTLDAGKQTAAFIGQIVGASGSSFFDNSISISSDQPIAVLGLVLESGGGLASIPVFPGRRALLF